VSHRNKDFSSQFVCPGVEEGQRPSKVSCTIFHQEWDLLTEELHRGVGGWVPGPMAMQDVDQRDVSSRGEGIFVRTKARWIREVRAISESVDYNVVKALGL
jgi:hypothetical protein